MERFVNLFLSIAVISFIWITKISAKLNIKIDVLRFTKNCDALNLEFFKKDNSFFKYFGYSDKCFGYCDIGG